MTVVTDVSDNNRHFLSFEAGFYGLISQLKRVFWSVYKVRSSEINKADLNSAIESNSFKRRHLFHQEMTKNGKAKLNSLEI